MVPDAVICSRLRRKADWGFFFQNKSKADADLDLAEPTTFADSWVAAYPLRCCRLLENTKHHRSGENRWTTSPGVLARRMLMWEKMKGFCFPSLQSPNWLTLVAWSPFCITVSPSDIRVMLSTRKGTATYSDCFYRKCTEIANTKDRGEVRGGGGACCFCFFFPSLYRKQNNFQN